MNGEEFWKSCDFFACGINRKQVLDDWINEKYQLWKYQWIFMNGEEFWKSCDFYACGINRKQVQDDWINEKYQLFDERENTTRVWHSWYSLYFLLSILDDVVSYTCYPILLTGNILSCT